MIFRFGNRLVILNSSKRKHDAWLIFILVYELGHLILNHLNETENVIFDQQLETPDNSEETAANDFAIDFLIESKNNIPNLQNISSTFKLINILKPSSQKFKIDTGVLTLMYAFTSGNFPSASKALNSMFPEANEGNKVIEFMRSNLELENLSEEDSDYFETITGLTEE
jgi:Zn-dependent peptidase ImmA (M78 family)